MNTPSVDELLNLAIRWEEASRNPNLTAFERTQLEAKAGSLLEKARQMEADTKP